MSNSYFETLNAQLDTSREMLKCLESRISFLDKQTDVSEYQLNENKILKIKTIGEIYTLKKIIAEKQMYYAMYAKQFDIDKADMEKNYDLVLGLAVSKKGENPMLKQFIDSVDFKMVNSGIEFKVNFYNKLKKLLGRK